VLGRGLLVAGCFFVAAESLVSGVGGQVLEFHGGGRIARSNTEVGANLASLENRCSGGCEQVRNRMVFALGEFKGAA
jgi:hypothetical protein